MEISFIHSFYWKLADCLLGLFTLQLSPFFPFPICRSETELNCKLKSLKSIEDNYEHVAQQCSNKCQNFSWDFMLQSYRTTFCGICFQFTIMKFPTCVGRLPPAEHCDNEPFKTDSLSLWSLTAWFRLLNVCCCRCVFFFLFFCNMVKINIHIYSEFVVRFKSGQYLHLLKPLAGQKNFQRPWPQCPGLNRSQTAQTSSPSLRQLPPGVIVVTMNDWQPPGCQSKCDLLRPHWFEPQNELWGFFFPSNITIIITWNTGHMMEMSAFVMWLVKTEKCRERQWRQTVTNAGWM